MDANFPTLDIESDTSLLDPDLDQLRQDRLQRNRAFLQSVNPRVAAQVLPLPQCLSIVEAAAITIQRFWRGHAGRQIYFTKLYDRYLKEEEQQQVKVLQQMEEGELLIENHQLEVLLDDGKTTRRNAERLFLSKVILIQRAWRKYIEDKQRSWLPVTYDDRLTQNSDSNYSNSNQAQSAEQSTPCDLGISASQGQDRTVGRAADISSECDENDDDGSENAYINPLTDVLDLGAEGSVYKQEEIAESTYSDSNQKSDQSVTKETDEDAYRNQRKRSYLAQAREFVELKKLNANALPFNLHILAGEPDRESPDQDKEMSEAMTVATEVISDSSKARTKATEVISDSSEAMTMGTEVISDSSEATTKATEVITDSSNDDKCLCDTQGNVARVEPFQDTGGDLSVTNAGSKSGVKTGDKTAGNSYSTSVNPDTTACVENKVEAASKGDISAFDVYNIETTLPNIDWKSLEKTLKAASEEEKKTREARRNDREEIRKKLAMGDEDEYFDDNEADDVSYKKTNFHSRLHSGLQICFMNESPGDTDSEGRSPRQQEFHDNMKLDPKDDDLVDSDNNLRTVQDLNQTASTSTSTIQNCSPPRLKAYVPDGKETMTDFHSKQTQLQNEARLALAQAGTMAHMQLEIEKQLQKKSPMAEMVGIPGLGERRRKKLSVRQLQEMNLAQIQVLYNDLQTQIENLNEELVHLLMERDELHMEQDSMLVDIEDLTRRAEELADKAKDVKNNVKGKLPAR